MIKFELFDFDVTAALLMASRPEENIESMEVWWRMLKHRRPDVAHAVQCEMSDKFSQLEESKR